MYSTGERGEAGGGGGGGEFKVGGGGLEPPCSPLCLPPGHITFTISIEHDLAHLLHSQVLDTM